MGRVVVAHAFTGVPLTVSKLFRVFLFEVVKKVCSAIQRVNIILQYFQATAFCAVSIMESLNEFHITDAEFFLGTKSSVLSFIIPPATLLNRECNLSHIALHVGYRP